MNRISTRIPICHVQVFPILSGPQRFMLDVFKHLDRDRYELHVACQGAGPLTEELERIDVPWHVIPTLDRPIRPVRDYRAYRALARLFRKLNVQLVHTHSSKPGVVGRLAARQAKVPRVVHHMHAFAFHEHSSALKRIAFTAIERGVSAYCDRTIFVNHEERRWAIETGLVPEDQCQTIYNGADLDAFDPARRQPARDRMREAWGLAADEVAIVFVGRLEYPKQPMLLPEIAAALDRARPEARWRLVIAGAGAEEAAVARRVRELGMERRVKMLGWQDDPVGVFHSADVVLLMSLAEGLPLSLIEASAAGVPIVASDAKGNREVVTLATGILCSPKVVDDYAAALARLVDSSELRETLGQAARRRAEEHFDSQINYRRIAALYDELLGGNAASKSLRRAA